MDAYSAHALSTAAWLTLQALPLILSPKLMVAMLSSETRAPTDLERYLCRIIAITLIFMALLHVLLVGSLPLSNRANEAERSPYKMPAAFLITSFNVSSLIWMYVNYMATGLSCFALGVVGSGFLACFGLWAMMFGEDNGGKSKVSGWPFRNDEERKAKEEKMMRKRR